MKTNDILKFLVNDIHTIVVATVDKNGYPVTSVIDMMLYKNDKLYFITAKGKSFYKRLLALPKISLSGLIGETTLTSVSVSLKGTVRDIGSHLLGEVFEKNPYMHEIYPTDESMEALTVFEIFEGEGEYFDLSKKPIERHSFSFGKDLEKVNPYFINEKCTACDQCRKVCPTSCILPGKPFEINQVNCLHCGNCHRVCAFDAVTKSI